MEGKDFVPVTAKNYQDESVSQPRSEWYYIYVYIAAVHELAARQMGSECPLGGKR